MPIRLTLSSDLFPDGPDQEVTVRDGLTVHKLLVEIQREYTLPQGAYSLRLRGGDQPLATNQTLEAAGVRAGSVLEFGLERPPRPRPAPAVAVATADAPRKVTNAYLRADSGQTFDLLRQPALIGRPNPQKHITASQLDVDLTPLDPTKSSSRPHAQIGQRGGAYILESLRDDNLAYVNDQAVAVGKPHPLRSGDRLRFGKVTLQFFTKEG